MEEVIVKSMGRTLKKLLDYEIEDSRNAERHENYRDSFLHARLRIAKACYGLKMETLKLVHNIFYKRLD